MDTHQLRDQSWTPINYGSIMDTHRLRINHGDQSWTPINYGSIMDTHQLRINHGHPSITAAILSMAKIPARSKTLNTFRFEYLTHPRDAHISGRKKG